MKPASFNYHRAHSVAEAVGLLAELGDEAKLIAGGQSLVAMMNFRLARPAHLIDIDRLAALRYAERDHGLRIGALTTHHQVETRYRTMLSGGFEVIGAAMPWIGHLPIRTRGTVGGSIAHADATAEWCLLAALLDAEIVAESVRGQRTIAASEFFFGYYSTALEPDEMIVEVRFPRPAPHAAITEFAQRHGDFATLGVAVAIDLDQDSVVGARIALGGVAPAPVRVDAAEKVLACGSALTSELSERCAQAAIDSLEFDDDAPGGPDYLRGLIRTLLPRALAAAVQAPALPAGAQ
ncbi:FAD binding domain-containing protein [Nocardia sp. R7R-8]|uniref:FAD binding domain-containing protein n=1 Tax=Nocardia sp. R7R-8 TaxID=3459304 RepID=UPI00403E07D7